MGPARISDIDWTALRRERHHPSPAAWEDQVLYFALVDRFSDGREDGYRDVDGAVVPGTTPPFTPADRGNAVATAEDAAAWRAAGATWIGGTLAGLESKIGYLARLGVTAIWVSPVLRQTPGEQYYHGYATQDFLEIDPHVGTAEDLRRLVATAHAHGLYVVLDVILNHAGDVFAYDPDRYWTPDGQGGQVLDPRWDGRPYDVAGFRDATGAPTVPFAPADPTAPPPRDSGVWPEELYDPATFSTMGRIVSWDHSPEYLEGDFYTLKDIRLGTGGVDDYRPSPALVALTRAYLYWIAYADLDGLRLDTVKHLDLGASRYFAAVVHEFAVSLGKENFYVLGEITGGRRNAYETLEITGIDAALGIEDVPDKLEGVVKGRRDAREYFDLFRNSLLVHKDSHVWFRNKVVTLFDDHDQVRKQDRKARFCATDDGDRLVLAAVALNVLTLGIPCLYYGTEQGLDGAGDNDRYIREALHGGAFGAFASRHRHVFDEDADLYRQVAALLALRRQPESIALRRGRQYLREISGDGVTFGLPGVVGDRMRSVVPWSRLFLETETICAISSDPGAVRSAWVTIDASLHRPGDALRVVHASDPALVGAELGVEPRNGLAVRLTVPPGGVVVAR